VRIVTVALEGLENILKAGEAAAKAPGGDGQNPYAQLVEDAEGLDRIEALQVWSGRRWRLNAVAGGAELAPRRAPSLARPLPRLPPTRSVPPSCAPGPAPPTPNRNNRSTRTRSSTRRRCPSWRTTSRWVGTSRPRRRELFVPRAAPRRAPAAVALPPRHPSHGPPAAAPLGPERARRCPKLTPTPRTRPQVEDGEDQNVAPAATGGTYAFGAGVQPLAPGGAFSFGGGDGGSGGGAAAQAGGGGGGGGAFNFGSGGFQGAS
jgi:hypothetical protein